MPDSGWSFHHVRLWLELPSCQTLAGASIMPDSGWSFHHARLWLELPSCQTLDGASIMPDSGWGFHHATLWLELPSCQTLAGASIMPESGWNFHHDRLCSSGWGGKEVDCPCRAMSIHQYRLHSTGSLITGCLETAAIQTFTSIGLPQGPRSGQPLRKHFTLD